MSKKNCKQGLPPLLLLLLQCSQTVSYLELLIKCCEEDGALEPFLGVHGTSVKIITF